jgi:MFS family permease
MLSVGVGAVAWILFGFAGEIGTAFGITLGLVVLFGAWLLAGAAGGNIATAQAYIADVTTPDERTGALGLVGAAFGLGFVFGPAIGGLLASDAVVSTARALLPGFVPVTQFSLPSFAAAGFSFLALAATALVLQEPDRVRRSAGGGRFVAQFRGALADRTLRPLVIGFFLTSLAFAGMTVMFVPFLADFFGYGATEAALFLALVLLAASPLAGTTPLAGGGPKWATSGHAVLLAFGALASFSNGAITVGLAALVSERNRGRTGSSLRRHVGRGESRTDGRPTDRRRWVRPGLLVTVRRRGTPAGAGRAAAATVRTRAAPRSFTNVLTDRDIALLKGVEQFGLGRSPMCSPTYGDPLDLFDPATQSETRTSAVVVLHQQEVQHHGAECESAEHLGGRQPLVAGDELLLGAVGDDELAAPLVAAHDERRGGDAV